MSLVGKLFEKLRKIFGRRKEDKPLPSVRVGASKPREPAFEMGADPETLQADGSFSEHYGIHKRNRVHTLVVGFPDTGKSTFLLFQMIQNVRNGEGVILFDPHGDLARKFLSHIPPDRWEDVVYIDPLTAWEFGRVVRLNLLQFQPSTTRAGPAAIDQVSPQGAAFEIGQGLAMRAFIDALHKLNPGFWGPRLEEILVNGLLALQEAKPGRATLLDLSTILADEDYRSGILDKVTDKEVRRFWYKIYKQITERNPDASTSVQTKIYKIIQEPVLKPMLSAVYSTIDFRSLMDENKIVIVNLPEGQLTSDITNFIGSMLLSMIYLAGMSRDNIPEEDRSPCYLYIDEAHRFITGALRDLMQALRKYKVFCTVASQHLNQYDREIREDIPSLCSIQAVFGCGKDTARRLEEFFTPAQLTYTDLINLPMHRFALSAEMGGVRESQILETIDPKSGPYGMEEVIKTSLEHYGEEFDVSMLGARSDKKVDIPYPELKPCELFSLVALAFAGEARRDTIVDQLKRTHGFPPPIVWTALNYLASKGYIEEERIWKDAAGHRTKRPYYYYYITQAGKDTLYPRLHGTRAGGIHHAILLGKLNREFWTRGRYPIVTSGIKNEQAITITYHGAKKDIVIMKWPDMVVYSPMAFETRGANIAYDSKSWDTPKRIAVEVETDPLHHGHMARVIAHYENCKEIGLPMMFVVSTKQKRQAIVNAVREAGATLVEDIFSHPEAGNVEVRIVDEKLPDDKSFHIQLEKYKQEVKEQGSPTEAEAEAPLVETKIPAKAPAEAAPGVPTRPTARELETAESKKEEREAEINSHVQGPLKPAGVFALQVLNLGPCNRDKLEKIIREKCYENGGIVTAALIRRGVIEEYGNDTRLTRKGELELKWIPDLDPKLKRIVTEAPETGLEEAPPLTQLPKRDLGELRTGIPVSAKRPSETGAKREIKHKKIHLSTLRKRLRELSKDDWTFRIQRRRGKHVLAARKWIDGKRNEKYVALYDERIKKMLKEMKISVQGA